MVANREENRKVDVERLEAAGIPVWVTEIESVAQAFGSLRRLFVDGLGVDVPVWLAQVGEPSGRDRSSSPPPPGAWSRSGGTPGWPSAPHLRRRRAGPLGPDPCARRRPERYPKLGLAELSRLGPDLVLLPDEPYAFDADDGPEAFPGMATALVSGRDLTWYGPSMATARPVTRRSASPWPPFNRLPPTQTLRR